MDKVRNECSAKICRDEKPYLKRFLSWSKLGQATAQAVRNFEIKFHQLAVALFSYQ